MATCASIVGYKLANDEGEDSVSLVPILRGVDKQVRETAIIQSISGMTSVRKGEWKLIAGSGSGGWTKGRDEYPGQLYNLAEDLGEKNNLFAEHPAKVGELTVLFKQLVESGRSTPGDPQKNDEQVQWNRMK